MENYYLGFRVWSLAAYGLGLSAPYEAIGYHLLVASVYFYLGFGASGAKQQKDCLPLSLNPCFSESSFRA